MALCIGLAVITLVAFSLAASKPIGLGEDIFVILLVVVSSLAILGQIAEGAYILIVRNWAGFRLCENAESEPTMVDCAVSTKVFLALGIARILTP